MAADIKDLNVELKAEHVARTIEDHVRQGEAHAESMQDRIGEGYFDLAVQHCMARNFHVVAWLMPSQEHSTKAWKQTMHIGGIEDDYEWEV